MSSESHHTPRKSLDLRFIASPVEPAPSPSHARRISIVKHITPTSSFNLSQNSPGHSQHQLAVSVPAHSRHNSLSAPPPQLSFPAAPGIEPQIPKDSPSQNKSSNIDPKAPSEDCSKQSKMQVYPISNAKPDGSQLVYDARGNLHTVKPPPAPPSVDANEGEANKEVWTDPASASSCSSSFQFLGFVFFFVAFHLFLFAAGTFYWMVMPDQSHIGLFYACFLSLNSGDPYCTPISLSSCTYAVDGGSDSQLASCSTFYLARGAAIIALVCSLLTWMLMAISFGIKSKIPRVFATLLGLASAVFGLLCMVEFLSFASSNSTGFSYSLGLAAWVIAFVGDVLYGLSLCT